jgi:hypothetical protein
LFKINLRSQIFTRLRIALYFLLQPIELIVESFAMPTDNFKKLPLATKSLLTQIQASLIQAEPISGGRNNRLWRLDTTAGTFCLKQYFPDQRSRLETEWLFLEHALNHDLKSVPQPMAQAQSEQLALYTWIVGTPLKSEQIRLSHGQQFLNFLQALNPDTSGTFVGQQASDSCFSLAAHFDSVARRMLLLESLPSEQKAALLLYQNEFKPLWQEIHVLWRDLAKSETLFSERECWLSPSDVGLHNALLEPDGQLAFLDFEYAGRDHRLKTLADFLTSVGAPVPLEMVSLFESFLENFPEPIEQRRLLSYLLPLHQLKWACILMGIFLPESASRRQFADHNQALIGVAQLQRIAQALERTRYWLRRVA